MKMRKAIYLIELLKRAVQIQNHGLIVEIPQEKKVKSFRTNFFNIQLCAKDIFFIKFLDEESENIKITEIKKNRFMIMFFKKKLIKNDFIITIK